MRHDIPCRFFKFRFAKLRIPRHLMGGRSHLSALGFGSLFLFHIGQRLIKQREVLLLNAVENKLSGGLVINV